MEATLEEHDYKEAHDKIHDCIMEIRFVEFKNKYSRKPNYDELETPSDEEIDVLIKKMPRHIMGEAFQWGLSDTCVGDSIYVWLQEKQEK